MSDQRDDEGPALVLVLGSTRFEIEVSPSEPCRGSGTVRDDLCLWCDAPFAKRDHEDDFCGPDCREAYRTGRSILCARCNTARFLPVGDEKLCRICFDLEHADEELETHLVYCGACRCATANPRLVCKRCFLCIGSRDRVVTLNVANVDKLRKDRSRCPRCDRPGSIVRPKNRPVCDECVLDCVRCVRCRMFTDTFKTSSAGPLCPDCRLEPVIEVEPDIRLLTGPASESGDATPLPAIKRPRPSPLELPRSHPSALETIAPRSEIDAGAAAYAEMSRRGFDEITEERRRALSDRFMRMLDPFAPDEEPELGEKDAIRAVDNAKQ